MTLAELNLCTDQIRSLYLVHLQQIYSAEEQAMTALPTVAIGISSLDLRQLLLEQAATTPDRLDRLQGIFAELGEAPVGPVCQPMKALNDLGMELSVHRVVPGLDLSLLAVAMEMKHLNIAKYTMAATFARTLNFPVQQMVLSKVMRDEMESEQKLRFAMQHIPPVTDPAEMPEEQRAALISQLPQS